MNSLRRFTAVMVLLCVADKSALGLDGFPILVTRNAAPIKVKSRVVGTASREMLLWGRYFSKDEQWIWVKVPSGERTGWISVQDVTEIDIPEELQPEWETARDYFPRWQALIGDGHYGPAATVASDAGDAMNRLLKSTIGAVYPGYPPASIAYNRAAVALLRQGRADEAIRNFDKALAISEPALGTRHVDTSVQRANAAEAEVLQGSYREAIEAFDQSLPVLAEMDLPEVRMEFYYLRYGTALAREHRMFDARLAFNESLRRAVARYGERSIEVAYMASEFSDAMAKAGYRSEAAKQLTQALEVYRQLTDPEDADMLNTLNRMSAYCNGAGQYEAARRHAKEATDIQRGMDDPDQFRLASSLNNLGLALAQLHNFSEAEIVLADAERAMVHATGKDSFLSSFPVKNRGILAMEQGNAAKADELYQRAIEIRKAAKAESNASVGTLKVLQGQAAIKAKNSPLARRLLTEAVQIQSTDLGVDHPDTRQSIVLLRGVIGPDGVGQDELDLLIAAARQRLRTQVARERPDSFYKLDSIAEEYRLQRVLAGRLTSPPEFEFYPLEVTKDASVRTGAALPAQVPGGTTVYAFRADGDRALIKVPGSPVLGWIAEGNVREIQYDAKTRDKLELAQTQLDDGWKEHESGNFQTSLKQIRLAVDTFESILGTNSAYLAAARYMLGSVLSASGNASAAVVECQAAEAVLSEVLGEHHSETAIARNNLAEALLRLGRPAEALRPAALALQTISGFEDDHKNEQAMFVGNAGLALAALSHYEAAREYLNYALKLSVEANGENHRNTAACYANLGKLHVAMQESDEAEFAFGKSYRISHRVSGATHYITTKAMLKYGEALVDSQKINDGRRFIEDAAAICLSHRGPQDPSTIEADVSRALLAKNVGDTHSAREIMLSAIERAGKRLNDDDPALLSYKSAFGEILYANEDYEPALKQMRFVGRSLADLPGEQNHDTIRSLNALGVCNAALGRLDVARVHYEQALRLGQKVLGPEHPDTTSYLFNIGEVALMAKDYVAARPRVEAAIEGFRNETNVVGVKTCVARTTLGYVDIGQQDTRAALRTFDVAARDTFGMMTNVLPALSEKEQLLFLQGEFRDMHDAWLSFALTADPDPRIAESAATWHLNMKGCSHELLAKQARLSRRAGTTNENTTYNNLISVREKLARLSLRSVPPDARAAHSEMIRDLSELEERLSREVGDEIARKTPPRKWLELGEFRQQIPSSAVVVNFGRIRNANFQYSSERSRWKRDRYIAWVVPANGKGDVVTIDLGLADVIDGRIAQVSQMLHSVNSLTAVRADGEEEASGMVGTQLSKLAAKVLHPLLPHIQNAEELVLSPDSQLWTIPWAALPVSDNQLALEKYRIRLLVSGRELISKENKERSSPIALTPPVIVANPQFDASVSTARIAENREMKSRLRSGGRRYSEAFRKVKPLPGTAAEAEAIKGAVELFAGAAPKMFLQQAAEESVVKLAQNPFCLVLSTHGFFFEAKNFRPLGSQRLGRTNTAMENPLLRCGLLFAGCHHAHTAGFESDDGILTGMEIINSDLRETELVVLSACETGLGDLRSGEGVAGLRQAFQLAGAKSVVASLWQVEDRSTSLLMDDFFRNLSQGMSKAEALRQAQLSRIQARREKFGAAHPFYWAAFTLSGHSQDFQQAL